MNGVGMQADTRTASEGEVFNWRTNVKKRTLIPTLLPKEKGFKI